MKITLKDGSVMELANGMAVIDIAKEISEGLARVATSAKVNGELVDLRTVVDSDAELEILTSTARMEKERLITPLLILWHRL